MTSETTSNHRCRRLEGRVAIVTGGGHGIGKAYARRLGEEGARVVVAEIDAPAAAATAGALKQAGVEALGVPTDVADDKSLAAMVERTLAAYGRIDILVNNAAIFATIPISRVPFDEVEATEWDRVMTVNVKGVWLACRAVVPVMKRQGYGKIINISSGSAYKGTGGRIHYATSKAALLGFTKNLARDLGDFNITVNNVAPGSTLAEETPTEEVIRNREKARAERALKRVQTPEDLLGAIAFFASPDSDFITGQTLIVDGGAYML